MITASIQNYRQSPRKVRVVANLIRGKKAGEAAQILKFINKKAGGPLSVLLNSAMANARHNAKINDTENLVISEVRVDAGYVLKRRMPRARGMAYPINKRTSHVSIKLIDPSATLSDAKAKSAKTKVVKTEVVAKPVAKASKKVADKNKAKK